MNDNEKAIQEDEIAQRMLRDADMINHGIAVRNEQRKLYEKNLHTKVEGKIVIGSTDDGPIEHEASSFAEAIDFYTDGIEDVRIKEWLHPTIKSHVQRATLMPESKVDWMFKFWLIFG